MRVLVKVKWIEQEKEWHLINLFDGKTVQEFDDSEDFKKYFKDPKKEKEETYDISIKPDKNGNILVFWSESENKWKLVEDKKSSPLHRFFDCGNFDRFFPGVDKEYSHRYMMSIVKFGEKH